MYLLKTDWSMIKASGPLLAIDYSFCAAKQHQYMALCVCFISFISFVRLSKFFCLNDQAYNCLIHFYSELIWKTNFDGGRPLMEDNL